MPASREQLAAQFGEIARATTNQMLREHGLVQPPTAHMFAEDMDPPYIGYVTTRPYHRGCDAEQAITLLGWLPSVLAATALVVTWEHADMCVSLGIPNDEQYPTAVAVLDASLGVDPTDETAGTTLVWHSFGMSPGPLGSEGLPTVHPTWHPPTTAHRTLLPLPIKCLLRLWRELRNDDLDRTVNGLQTAGYQVRFAQR